MRGNVTSQSYFFYEAMRPSPTLTPTTTSTPTATPTATSTPVQTQVSTAQLPPLQLYQSPGGPVVGQLHPGQSVTVLYDRQTLDGLTWVKVIDSDGRIGWIPDVYLREIEFTPTPTP